MTTGNPTLDKNLHAISRYNPKLTQDLLNLPYLTNKFDLIETELKEPNLAFNGIPLHLQKGAEAEAKQAFKDAINTPTSMHVVFGIGLGHIFKEFCEHSKGTVLLYEPNLEILRVTLELVDFSKELSLNNVFVSSDIENFKIFYSQHYTYQASTSFTCLSSYRDVLYKDRIRQIISQIETIAGACQAEYNTLKQAAQWSIEMVLDNLIYTIQETPLIEFKDTYKGKTALIVSAGPSLDANIEIIKKNRDKMIIFCVGTAFKALANNGITPDFVNIIEINDCSGQVKGFDLSKTNFILEPYTHTSIHKLQTGPKLLFPSNTSHANNYWANLTGVNIYPYTTKGTVSYESLFAAKILGCKKMILIGQDLAYINNQCYSSGAAYSELSFEVNPGTGKPEFKIRDYDKYIKSLLPVGVDTTQDWCKYFADYKIKNLNETLFFVKGITGEMLPTQSGYATFIEHFREFAFYNKTDLELINSSMIGAQIDGFENISLEDALKDVEPIKENKNLPQIPFTYNKNKILRILEEEENVLKKVLKEFEPVDEYSFKYEREVQRRRVVTPEAGKYFNLLLNLYKKVQIENQGPLYQAISFTAHADLQFRLKETENFDTANIQLIYELLKIYFTTVKNNTFTIINKIDTQKGIINESIDSKGEKSFSNN